MNTFRSSTFGIFAILTPLFFPDALRANPCSRLLFAIGRLQPYEVKTMTTTGEGLKGQVEHYLLDEGTDTIRRHRVGDGVGGWVTGSWPVYRTIVRVFDENGTQIFQKTVKENYPKAAFSGRHLFIHNDYSLQIFEFDSDNRARAVLNLRPKLMSATALEVNAVSDWNGNHLLILTHLRPKLPLLDPDNDKGPIEVSVFDKSTNESRRLWGQLGLYYNTSLNCRWSPNGRYVGFGDATNTYVHVFDLETGREVATELIGKEGYNTPDAFRRVQAIGDDGKPVLDNRPY